MLKKLAQDLRLSCERCRKQLSKDADKSQTELNELTANYIEAKAKLEEETRRYKLKKKLEKKGLHETVNPTKVIRIKKKD